MLHAFFECSFHQPPSASLWSKEQCWLTSLAVTATGTWTCYVSDRAGCISLYRKGSDANAVDAYVAQFTGQITLFSRWERVHRLGISSIMIVQEENYIVTTGYDSCCKILDATQGQPIFVIDNPRKCLYTGVAWKADAMTLTLIDELGYLDVFSTFLEQVTSSCPVIRATSQQHVRRIQYSHKDPLLGALVCLRGALAGHTHADASASANASGGAIAMSSSSNSADRHMNMLALMPFEGKIALWQVQSNYLVKQFRGHEGSVVGISLLKRNADNAIAITSASSSSRGSAALSVMLRLHLISHHADHHRRHIDANVSGFKR